MQTCELGGWYTVLIGIFAFLSLTYFIDQPQVGAIWFSLGLPIILIFTYRFLRWLPASIISPIVFQSFILKHYPGLEFKEAGKTSKSRLHNPLKYYEGFPTINSISRDTSQQRFLDSLTANKKKFYGYSFEELVDVQDDELWKIVHEGQTLAMVIVSHTFTLPWKVQYMGEVVHAPKVDPSSLGKGQLIQTISGSTQSVDEINYSTESNQELIPEHYTVGWACAMAEEFSEPAKNHRIYKKNKSGKQTSKVISVKMKKKQTHLP